MNAYQYQAWADAEAAKELKEEAAQKAHELSEQKKFELMASVWIELNGDADGFYQSQEKIYDEIARQEKEKAGG